MNDSKNQSESQIVPLFAVYVIWCSKTNMHYVGITKQKVRRRIHEHRRGKKQLIDREIQKLGWEGNFDWWLVEENIPSDQISVREQHWVAIFDSVFPNGYNKTHGGIGDTIMSEDTLAKMRKRALERDIRGEKHPFYGKHHTAGTKARMRDRRHTDEELAKMSAAMQGEKNPFYGKHHTDEAKERNRQAHLGKTPWNKGKKSRKKSSK